MGMFLTDDDVKEFKNIYEKEFNEALSEKEARIMASQLICLYEILAHPLPRESQDLLASAPKAIMLDV